MLDRLEMTGRRASAVFGNAALLALFVGACFSWLGVAVSSGSSAFRNPLDTLVIALLAAGPAVLLSAVVAGYLASSIFSTGREWPLSRWVRQGLIAGAVVGACALGGWLGAINFTSSIPFALSTSIVVVGAAAGALTGAVVASYCWQISRA